MFSNTCRVIDNISVCIHAAFWGLLHIHHKTQNSQDFSPTKLCLGWHFSMPVEGSCRAEGTRNQLVVRQDIESSLDIVLRFRSSYWLKRRAAERWLLLASHKASITWLGSQQDCLSTACSEKCMPSSQLVSRVTVCPFSLFNMVSFLTLC